MISLKIDQNWRNWPKFAFQFRLISTKWIQIWPFKLPNCSPNLDNRSTKRLKLLWKKPIWPNWRSISSKNCNFWYFFVLVLVVGKWWAGVMLSSAISKNDQQAFPILSSPNLHHFVWFGLLIIYIYWKIGQFCGWGWPWTIDRGDLERLNCEPPSQHQLRQPRNSWQLFTLIIPTFLHHRCSWIIKKQFFSWFFLSKWTKMTNILLFPSQFHFKSKKSTQILIVVAQNLN